MKKYLVTILFILSTTGLAFAESSPEKSKAIREMFDLMDIEKQFAESVNIIRPMLDQMATSLQLSASERKELDDIFLAWFTEDFDQEALMQKIAALYSATFTLEEIKQINQFYRTPVGKKMLEKHPELFQKGSEYGMAESQKQQHKLMQRLRPFFAKHGQ